jgi:Family of unknown function (DUF5995)
LRADKALGPIAPEASATIAEVIARMEQIVAELPRKDGVAYFNRLYLQVTKAVQTATASVTFEDPDFTERLDVVFAGLYFTAEETIASGAPCPIAWRPPVDECFADRTDPVCDRRDVRSHKSRPTDRSPFDAPAGSRAREGPFSR